MAGTLIRIEEPARRSPAPRGTALLALGFRPFYLLAAIHASVVVPLWVAHVTGLLPGLGAMPGMAWHAHEMLFGTLAAVIAGFLLTAVRLWTGRPTPTGAPLAALALLWLFARVAAWTGPGWLAASANVAFPWVMALVLGYNVVRAGNWRNLGVIALLFGLGAAALCFHLALAGIGPHDATQLAVVALDLVVLLVSLMGGRVIPAFTASACPGAAIARRAWLDRAVLGVTGAIVAADLIGLSGLPFAALLTLGAALHLARAAGWAPQRTLDKPILWILHLSYAWIAVGFLLRAWFEPAALGLHALAIGAAGGMVMGMMTRTARGHTARPLRADAAELAMYLLIQIAAVLRIAGPLLWPASTSLLLGLSAAAWSGAFALYALRYAPILLRPRLDGKPG